MAARAPVSSRAPAPPLDAAGVAKTTAKAAPESSTAAATPPRATAPAAATAAEPVATSDAGAVAATTDADAPAQPCPAFPLSFAFRPVATTLGRVEPGVWRPPAPPETGSTAAARSKRARPSPPGATTDAPAAGCPVFLAGVPIDEAAARWLTATARAARVGDPEAPLALWLALRPRFRRWAEICLRRAGADDLRRDGVPWLLEDLLQEAFPVLLAVVADWPDGDPGRAESAPRRGADPAPAGAGSAIGAAASVGIGAAPTGAESAVSAVSAVGTGSKVGADQDGHPAEAGRSGATSGRTAETSEDGATTGGDGAATAADGSFLPWLLAVAPCRLWGVFATLRDRGAGGRGSVGVDPRGTTPDPRPRRLQSQLQPQLQDGTAEAAEAAARLAAIAAGLDRLDAALLLAHVGDGEPVARAGRRLGLDRGAAYHRWRRLRARLRAELLG